MRHTSRDDDSSSSSSSSNSGGGGGGRDYSEEEGKKEGRQDEEKVNPSVHQVEDQVMVQLRAHALVRGHECEYLMTKREMVLGRVAGERSAEDGVVGVTESKRVSRKAVRIRYNEKAE